MSDPEFEFIKLETRGSTATLTLDRPPVNVIHIPMMAELKRAIQHASQDQELKVLVLRAEGKLFSAGVDVLDHTQDRVEEMLGLFNQVCVSLAEFPLPTIAAVQGHALGGGCELVLSCDMAWMAEHATIGQPEIKLAAIAPIAALRLPALVGPRWAAQLLFSGEAVDGHGAAQIGLVNAAVPAAELESTVEAIVAQLSSLSAAASRVNKQGYLVGMRGWQTAVAELEGMYFNQLMTLADAQEGLQAFVEKRTPVWKNK